MFSSVETSISSKPSIGINSKSKKMPLFLIKRKSILKFIGSFQLTVESFSSRSTRVEVFLWFLPSSSSPEQPHQAVLSLFKDLGKAWYRRPKGLAYAKVRGPISPFVIFQWSRSRVARSGLRFYFFSLCLAYFLSRSGLSFF